MSYSRWSNSRWYTFWSCQPDGEIETRQNAIFEVCGVERFMAKQLRERLEECVDAAISAEKRFFPESQEVTDEQRDELREYMRRFLADVDARYPRRLRKRNRSGQ